MPRPRSFDPDQALETAMTVFWERGYGGASIEELTERMGINRFSLYDVFGDKRALYASALDLYRATFTERMIVVLQIQDGDVAIEKFFRELAGMLTRKAGCFGCLVQNTAVELAPHEETMARRVRGIHADVEVALLGALERIRAATADKGAEGGDAKGKGKRDLKTKAHGLFALAQGMTVLARAGESVAAIESVADFAIQQVDW